MEVCNQKEKGNLKLVDIIKLVMSILVVSIHTLPRVEFGEYTIAYGIWWVFAQVAVPFFFLSTGYFISREYRQSESKNLTEILKKYLVRYIKIYIIWSLIYLPLAIVYYLENNLTFFESIKGYVWELIFSGQHYNSWVLWYILSSTYTFVVLLIISLYKGEKKCILFCLSFVTLVIYIGVHVIKGLDDIHSFYRLLNGCIYVPLGMLIYDYQQNREIRGIPHFFEFVLSAVVSVALQLGGVQRIVFELITWFAATALFICIINSRFEIRYSTVGCRKVSSYVYYLHLWIWTIYYMIAYGKKHYGLDAFLVVSSVALIVSILWYAICTKRAMIYEEKFKSE